MGVKKVAGLVSVAAILGLAAKTLYGGDISREELVEDVRQLANTIEDVHPDPYINGGGKIAFHRRLQNTLAAIPDGGMTTEEFYRLLRPFVAAVGDAHTWLKDPYSPDPYSPGGIPLYFQTTQDGLYVFAVIGEANRGLIGARLVSVEGVPLDELVRRQGQRMGSENDYLLLRNLDRQGVLWYRCFLEHLIPEWNDKSKVTVELQHRDGHRQSYTLDIPDKIDYTAFIYPASKLQMPSLMETLLTKCDFGYDFVDSTKRTCVLAINNMSSYREAFEMWADLGVTGQDEHAREVFRKFQGADPPEEKAEVIRGVPSATEVFRSMVIDMKESGTSNLLIDLRDNDGGNSAMYNILIYFLYGRDRLLSLKGRSLEIRKLSKTYFASYPEESLDSINRGRALPLAEGDYDFQYDYPHNGYPGLEAVTADFETFAAMMPTFFEEWKSSAYDGYYSPERVFVTCSPGTFSSAFTMMHYLQQAGAKTVGLPSSQGGNCYGDIIGFELDHTRLKFNVPHKYFELFPDDNERGKLLPPDYLLTYEKLASYDFDPNAEVLFALDIIRELEVRK